MSAVHEVVDSAMKLTRDERVDVVVQLLRSLEEADSDVEAAWKTEIDSRLEAMATGNYETFDWRDTIADIRKSLQERRKS